MIAWLLWPSAEDGSARGLSTRPTVSRPATAPAKVSGERCRKVAREQLKKMDGSFRAVVVPPFVVVGNLPKDRLRRHAFGSVVRPAEAMWKSYFTARPDEPILALLFKDDKTYRHWAKELFGDTDVSHYGYYRSGDQTMVMNISTGGGTLVHELTHALIRYDFPNVPSWFNEGLGSLHEQCSIRTDVVIGLVNWRLPALQKAVKSGKLRSLKDLFGLSTRQFYREQSGLNYAQARYFVMYMQQRGVLREFYAAYRDGKGKGAVKIVEKVFGKPLATVEADLPQVGSDAPVGAVGGLNRLRRTASRTGSAPSPAFPGPGRSGSSVSACRPSSCRRRPAGRTSAAGARRHL